MPETNDIELLRQYARNGSEEAFGALTTRHVNLVYSTALRATGNPQAAEEITQAVFVILARKAGTFSGREVITGWLYRTTQLTAANYVRGEIRRARREQEAHLQMTANEPETSVWLQIAPVLDAALNDLGEADRSAILLRFFENKSPAELAAALRIGEPTARKRVSRAVERLRKFFSARGISLSAAAIGAAISANSVQAAPVGLAASATAVAAKSAVAGGSTMALVDATMKILAWAKIKLAIAVSVTVLAAAGTTALVVNNGGSAPAPDIQGAWEGIAGLPTDRFTHKVVMRISGSNGFYRATVDIIDRNKQGIPLTRFVYKYPKIYAESVFPGGSAKMEAEVIDGANGISGQWVQQNSASPVQLIRTNTPTAIPGRFAETEYAPRSGSVLQGYWKGTLASLPVVLRIAEPTNGTFRAQFDSVQEGIRNIPVHITYSNPPAMTAEVIGFSYFFRANLEGDRNLIGSCTVGTNRNFRVTFQRADPAPDIARENSLSYDSTSQDELQGHWKGVLATKRGGRTVTLDVVLNIARLSDGTFCASLDSPDEFETGIDASALEFNAPDLRIKWVGIGSTLEAKLERGKITGMWHDDHGLHKLSLERRAD